MAVERISEDDTRITGLLDKAREEPLILETEGVGDFALLPLDEDVIDLLLERSPALVEECRKIRERMNHGEYLTHKQMLEALKEAE